MVSDPKKLFVEELVPAARQYAAFLNSDEHAQFYIRELADVLEATHRLWLHANERIEAALAREAKYWAALRETAANLRKLNSMVLTTDVADILEALSPEGRKHE